MFNEDKFNSIIAEYKKQFIQSQWAKEKFKWEAVKCFQDNWDVDAINFTEMLKNSLAKTGNLLASKNNFPKDTIISFSERNQDKVRKMFSELFNENETLHKRISSFKEEAKSLLKNINNNSYQTENAITTYLWLKYPDKYYIYKFSDVVAVSNELESNYIFKRGEFTNNIENFFKFYDEISSKLQSDNELKNILSSVITDTCYPDPKLKTLTLDVGFFISRYYSNENDSDILANEWEPTDYSPKLSIEDWENLLKDSDIFDEKSLKVMKCMKDCGGTASCTQLSRVYGDTINFYNTTSSNLAKRIVEKTGCPKPASIKNNKWWPVLYLGRSAEKNEEGSFIWKLRDELSEALNKVDLSYIDKKNSTDFSLNQKKKYTKEDFLKDVYISEEKYDKLVTVLKRKKNIILQGAPGVGKTFLAKRLAYSIMGEKDDERINFIQFHQNYSYEDFVMGYKPIEEGFKLKYGIFYNFCQKATKNPDKDYFFIIDEINRGNLSKIFGELLMLIEADYRDEKATLAYTGSDFSVPKNLHIIGMMNIADRSLAMIDYALRRRFSFFDIEPAFDSEGFSNYQKEFSNKTFNELIEKIKKLNEAITQDQSLGKGFCIGHSYFCNAEECTLEWMKDIVEFDIFPMLSEYWFDDESKLNEWKDILYGVFE